MPVEIKELIIEAKMAEEGERTQASDLVTMEDLDKLKQELIEQISSGKGPNSRAFRREVIDVCLEAVREMLENERRQ